MRITTKKLNIMRLLALITVCSALIGLTVIPTSALESGSCGENVTWELNAGTLSIKGSGEMADFKDSQLAPWYEFRDDIVRLEISDQIKSIGNYAFYGCKNIVSVRIPNSVKKIGKAAFASCERLRSVQMGGSVESIGDSAFYSCYALESIRLPYGLSYLGEKAFYRCESLACITVPSDVRTMGDSVFAYCKKLVRAEIKAPLAELPSWTFYGCEMLVEVSLAESYKTVGNNGFKNCELLSVVYFSGKEAQAEELKEQISEDLSGFGVVGQISSDEMSSTSISGSYVENNDQTVVQTNTVISQDKNITIGYTVQNTYHSGDIYGGDYTVDIFLTVQENDNWDQANEQVKQVLTEISDTYVDISEMKQTTLTVYMENDTKVSDDLLKELSFKKVKLVLISPNGSTWKIDCNELSASKPSPESESANDYSYTIVEAPAQTCSKLGTENCFRLIFDKSAKLNAEVIVQLPTKTAVQSNAFLYQVGGDGNLVKLQAVAVDNDGYAHFYIASVNSGVEYIIGLNVPGESTDDVIIPPELLDPSAAAALERLENIKYVDMGVQSSWNVGVGHITWILIGVLVLTTVVVGAIMLMWNKKQKQKLANQKKK